MSELTEIRVLVAPKLGETIPDDDETAMCTEAGWKRFCELQAVILKEGMGPLITAEGRDARRAMANEFPNTAFQDFRPSGRFANGYR